MGTSEGWKGQPFHEEKPERKDAPKLFRGVAANAFRKFKSLKLALLSRRSDAKVASEKEKSGGASPPESEATFVNLPPEILLFILDYLNLTDAINVSISSRTLLQVLGAQYLVEWKDNRDTNRLKYRHWNTSHWSRFCRMDRPCDACKMTNQEWTYPPYCMYEHLQLSQQTDVWPQTTLPYSSWQATMAQQV